MGKKGSNEQDGDDLIYLPDQDLNDSEITALLNDRFSKDQIFTRIGQRALISVNPCKPLESNSDAAAKSAGNAVKEGEDRQAHLFEMAATCYYDMLKNKADQSITFVGETGSGKSESLKLAVKELIAVGKSKRKEDKVSIRLEKALTILEAFGHAKTIQNENSSRFGKCVEVQFNSRGRLSGAKILDYLLEKPRASTIPYGERGFHAFYYLLAGASADEKSDLVLQDPSRFKILAASKTYRVGSIDDASQYAELKLALKACGFKEKYQDQIFQLLASILHLGNLEFESAEARDEAAVVRNVEELDLVADLLGLRPRNLENALVYKTKLIKKEVCSMFLDKDEAAAQRDELIGTLYSLLFSYILDTLNKKLNDEEYQNYISLVDMFGMENLKDNRFYQLLYNFTAERMIAFVNRSIFDSQIAKYNEENLPFPQISYADNGKILELYSGEPSGVLTMLDEESRARKRNKMSTFIENLNAGNEKNPFFIAFKKKTKSYLFGVVHHKEDVHYDAKEFIDNNTETFSADFITLFKGGPENRPSKNSFVAGIFSDKVLSIEHAPQSERTAVGASLDNAPRRQPSTRRTKKAGSSSSGAAGSTSFAAHYSNLLDSLLEAVSETQQSLVFCLKPNVNLVANRFEVKVVQPQVEKFGISDVARFRAAGYNLSLPFDAFVDRYRIVGDSSAIDSAKNSVDKTRAILGSLGLVADDDYVFGKTQIFFREDATRITQQRTQAAEQDERRRIKEKIARSSSKERLDAAMAGSQVSSSYSADEGSEVGSEDEGASTLQTDDENTDDNNSYFGSDFTLASDADNATPMGAEDAARGAAPKDGKQEVNFEEEEEPISSVRRHWLRCTTFLTWWIPTKCLEWNGMKRADIQQAWREKVALCILILLLSALMLFFITGFSLILCPHENMWTPSELTQFGGRSKLYVAVYGNVYDYTGQRNTHAGVPEAGAAWIDQFAGKIADELFPVAADQICGTEFQPKEPLDLTRFTEHVHDATKWPQILNRKNKKLYKGSVSYRWETITRDGVKANDQWVVIKGRIYNMTSYLGKGETYLGEQVTAALTQFVGQDATNVWNKLPGRSAAIACMDLMNFIGVVDTRSSPQCIFADSLLLAATGVLVAIMVIKFLAALQLSSKGEPEDHDRFVICQMPCYTEGEESLRRSLDSLAALRYDDKRKLLFIMADGNIIGSGNDRATWRIVLDLLGVDPSIDPPKLSFQSLGEGNRQHNMGKVYTGLYDCSGHLVPYIVVVKVGKDSETRRPGNRGKRDSQLILMRFLQKVHYDEPMSPLELEIYHQIKNVIGVDPSFYEFTLMVDADTEVMPDSLNRMVSAMVHDAKIVGICGETTISNDRDTWITMMQVYEYYISHHLAKAFESLFGSVTCLPGCFCMYRIRTPNKSIPLLISKPVVSDYSVNDVDTLHKKNLLSLGEDRYLTTLMLKHFPNMKLSFTPDAMCKTYAPDRWSVLLSQRRRWINSTVHNLAELLLLPQLCGFCCFSMRFIVFFDLFATLVMPATMCYLGYLIYEAASGTRQFPLISLIMLAAAYGLQVVIFMLKKKWDHIIWLVIYILAMPVFTFFIPVYAFWHFDDFSWGSTRIVVGERGGKKQIVDEEPFDPNSIPMKRWSEYEQEMWEKDSQMTGSTGVSRGSYKSAKYSRVSGATGSQMAPQSFVGSGVYGQPAMMMPMMAPPAYANQPMQMPVRESEQYPTDDQIISQVKTMLSSANLMTVTKKQVRDDLALFFSTDMSSRKDFINKVIEDVLQGKL